MKILAVTEDRPEKIKEPLRNVSDTETIDLAEIDSRLKKTVIGAGMLLKMLWNEDIDVILANRCGVTSFLATIFGKVFSTPSIIRLGGNPWKTYREKLSELDKVRDLRQWIKYRSLLIIIAGTASLANGAIVVSQHLKSSIEDENSFSRNSIKVVNTHICLNKVNKKDQNRTNNDRFTISTVTNLQFRGKYEGVKDTIANISALLEENEELTYIIAGDGRYYDQLCEYVESTDIITEKISEQIQIVGHVNDINHIYKKSDIFVYVSYFDAYPNVILEAQLHKLPVITIRDQGMKEQVEHEKTGVLVENISLLSEKVSRLLSNPSERMRLGKNAHKSVIKNNSPERCGTELVDAIGEILQTSSL